MATKIDPAVRRQLEIDLAAIGRDCPAPRVEAPPMPESVLVPTGGDALVLAEPFGRWLLSQKDRGDWIDELATAARKDPRFPKSGTPDEVRGHLTKQGITEPDVFEQIDDAERMWLSC